MEVLVQHKEHGHCGQSDAHERERVESYSHHECNEVTGHSKLLIVDLGDAVVHPLAVMVKVCNANLTYPAVFGFLRDRTNANVALVVQIRSVIYCARSPGVTLWSL